MRNVATRLLSLILLLQSKPSWKAAELSRELEVSERTIHRYMGMLDEMGIPISSERGPYGGFSLLRGYKLPPLLFTAEEATVLYMGANLMREVWGKTYRDAVTAVTAKLDNVLPDDLRHQVSQAQQNLVVLGLAGMDYTPWEPTIHTLRQSVGHRKQVNLRYKGFSYRTITERVVDPYALTFRWGLWYLVGYCHLRRALRTFRIDRIQGITPLETSYAIPADFDVRVYLEESTRPEPAYTVEVRLQASVAPEVRERHGHWMTLSDQPDGSLIARFGVASLDWAAGWVLRHGGAATVIAPAELATKVRQAAEGILSQYQNSAG